MQTIIIITTKTMKKTYIKPIINVIITEADGSLLAGSISATDEKNNFLEGITGGDATETGTETIIEADSKVLCFGKISSFHNLRA